MNSVLFGSLVLFSAASLFTPGPNNIMMMSSGAHFGFRKSVPHMLGVMLGFPFMTLLAGIGLGAILQRYPLIHELLRFAGAAYIGWMAWKIANTKTLHAKEDVPSKPLTFLQAVLFQWINPKAWTMVTSTIAAYTTAGGDFTKDLAIIVGCFLFIGIPSACTWTFGGKLMATLLHSPRRFRIFNLTMAALLALSIITIFLH